MFVVVATLLYAGHVRPAVAASSAAGRVVTLRYEGSYDGTVTFDEAELGTVVSHVTWDFDWTGTLHRLLAPALKVFEVNTLTGTETVSQHGMTCTVSFSENPATGTQTPVGRILNAYRDPADPSKVVVRLQAPLGLQDLISDDPTCTGNGADGAGGPGQQVEIPTARFDPADSGSQTRRFDGSWSASDTISHSTSRVRSAVTFGGGCDATLDDVPLAGGAARAAARRAKKPKVCKLRKRRPPATLPQKPLSNPLTNSEWQWLGGKMLPSIREDEANLLVQAGAGELASKLFIAATPLAPYELAVMAATLGAHATEFIGLEAEYDDWFQLFQKDPPDAATSNVALPSPPSPPPAATCLRVKGRYARRARTACDGARPRFAAVAAGTALTTSLLRAALITANRYATALRDGQTAAVGLQQTAEGILAAELAGAVAKERADRLRLADWERAQGLPTSFTRAQLLALARKLRSRHGRPVGPIRSLGPPLAPARLAAAITRLASRIGPGRLDVIGDLRGDGGAAAALAAANPAVTPASVAGVVVALTAQRSVSPQAEASALSALDAVSTAASPASVQAALGRLTSTAQTVGGAAGAYLAAAERLLAASLPDVVP